MGTHLGCLVNGFIFVSIMSWVLIWSVLTIVDVSPLCHGYSLGGVLSIVYLSQLCLGYSLGVP